MRDIVGDRKASYASLSFSLSLCRNDFRVNHQAEIIRRLKFQMKFFFSLLRFAKLPNSCFHRVPAKNQSTRSASRDSPQFSFGDLISFNNHSSFPPCLRPIVTEKTTLFADEEKSQRVSRSQLLGAICIPLPPIPLHDSTSKNNERHADIFRFGLTRNTTLCA